jgi:AcrR family transcriptional regulator
MRPAGTRPCRRPTQTRAKAKVDAILAAADELLRDTPADRLVMRDVARRAGVKPATLYDYFPDKQLLLRALEDRSWARAAARATTIVGAEGATSLGDGIAAIVESIMREMGAAARAHGLTPTSPFGPEQREALGAQFAAMAAGVLGERASDFDALDTTGDLHLRLHIATETVAMLTWVAARDHPAALQDGSYPKEVGRLIARYLVRAA